TSASVKVAASGSKAIQPSGNVKGGNVKTAGKVKGAATGSKAATQNGQPSGNAPNKQPKKK
ncbi:hypothetical protein Tco_0538945, partial [Tanacetum coccineum]